MYSGKSSGELTTKNKKRKRAAFEYSFEGRSVCSGAFRYMYNLGSREFRNLHVQFHLQNGVVPRVLDNKGRRPQHALSFAKIENCAKFIKRFGGIHGLPQPAPLLGRDDQPPVNLPASSNYKSVKMALRLRWHSCCWDELIQSNLAPVLPLNQIHDTSFRCL